MWANLKACNFSNVWIEKTIQSTQHFYAKIIKHDVLMNNIVLSLKGGTFFQRTYWTYTISKELYFTNNYSLGYVWLSKDRRRIAFFTPAWLIEQGQLLDKTVKALMFWVLFYGIRVKVMSTLGKLLIIINKTLRDLSMICILMCNSLAYFLFRWTKSIDEWPQYRYCFHDLPAFIVWSNRLL